MNPDADRFIELAARSLDDNAELQLSAEAELRKAIGANAASHSGALTAAVHSLEHADKSPRRRWWRIALLGGMALVSLPLLVQTAMQCKNLVMVRSMYTFEMDTSALEKSMVDLTPKQKLLLFGASGAANDEDRWKPLWESEPENPAYLAEYAMAYFRAHGGLSPEILGAAGNLDSDNAWFPAIAAAGIADKAVSKVRVPSSGGKRSRATPVWKIDDEKRLKDSLSAIHGFTSLPRFEPYQKELLTERMPLLPPRRDFVSQYPPIIYAFSMPTSTIQFRRFADVMAAGAQQCAATGDVEGFQQIIRDWKWLSEIAARNSATLVDGLVAKMIITSPLANYRDAARTLGLEKNAAYFEALDHQAQMEKDARNMRHKPLSPMEQLIERRSSVFFGMTGPMVARQVKSPPPLTEHDLKPGRFADHALLERAGSWAGWLLLGIGAGLAGLSGKWGNPLARRLSVRMQDLFRLSDWLWVIVGGLVLPVVWYFAITRFTPLAAREWSARLSMFIQPGGQFGGMLLSMIILPVLIASGRLAKRGAALGLAPRFRWLGWLAAVAALLSIPAYGSWLIWGNSGQIRQYIAFGLSGFAVIWILVGLGLKGFGSVSQALRRATLARLLPPVWVCGMLMLAMLVPYFYSQEKRWIQQDQLFGVSAEFPAPMRYEHEVTKILRGELLEMLEGAEISR